MRRKLLHAARPRKPRGKTIEKLVIPKASLLQGIFWENLSSLDHVLGGFKDGVEPDIDEYGVGLRRRIGDASDLVKGAEFGVLRRRAWLRVEADAGGMIRANMPVSLIENVKRIRNV
jgi:hypothetical protein